MEVYHDSDWLRKRTFLKYIATNENRTVTKNNKASQRQMTACTRENYII